MSKSNAKAAAARLKQQQEESQQEGEKQSEVESGSAAVSDDSVNETAQAAEQSVQESGTASNTETGTDVKNETAATEEKLTQKKEDNKLVQVEFVGPYKRYSKGDIAAFSKNIAEELIEKGAAVRPGDASETEQEPV